mmetsp:Transcript_24013/g.74407  ORF Transcript_24013/g.74407 Transcript_24013/m.74407 type:complete len:221 (-) Transcript_24013:12-674(-)
MSPMSSRMVEISAVTVASTRCLDVMMECVESTRARISSRSTFTASMAAVKSSMSRSQARTMRRMWFTSPLLLLSRSLSSPTSYFSWSRSSAMVSKPAEAPAASSGRMEDAPLFTCASFLSKSLCMLESCAVSCASKSCSRVDTFFRIWASLPAVLREGSKPPSSGAGPSPACLSRSPTRRSRSRSACCTPSMARLCCRAEGADGGLPRWSAASRRICWRL